MMAARRSLAVLLALLLIPLFAASLITGRVNATVLDSGYVKQQLRDIDLYQRVDSEAMPSLVDDLLPHQDSRLPDNLRGIGLPTDTASRDRIVEVLRTVLPPAFLQAHAEQAIDALIPWTAGRTAHFSLDLSLKQNVLALFGHAEAQQSLFERAWLDLGMSDRVLRGLSTDLEGQDGLTVSRDPAVVQVLGSDYPTAVTWLDEQIFGVVDAMLPYLVGDQPAFTATVTFDRYPPLADLLARPLNSTPAQLRAVGYTIDSAEVERQIGGADSPAVNQVDNTLALFRDRGYRWTDVDLRERIDARPPEDSGPNPFTTRRTFSALRLLAVWGPVVLSGLLIAGIAFLGARRWPSRVAWGASGLLVASLVSLMLATAVYGATAGRQVTRWAHEQRAEASGALPASLRNDLVDEVAHAANGAAAHAAATSRNWLLLSMLALGGALAWPHRGRLGRAGRETGTVEDVPPPDPPPAPPST